MFMASVSEIIFDAGVSAACLLQWTNSAHIAFKEYKVKEHPNKFI